MGEGENAVVAVPSHETQAATAVDPPVQFIDPVDRYAALAVRFARFEHVAQIPRDFIRKELELKGTVREVLPSGELRVEHVPIVRLPFFPKKPAKGLLNIRLAGVDMSDAGQQFIAKDLRLRNKPITFKVIKLTDGSTDTVDADVTVKKSTFTRTNLNIELVRRGYARVPPPESPRHLKALQSIPAYSRLINRLLMSEKVADRRGVGLWERDSWVESVRSYPSQVKQIVRTAPLTKFVVLLFTIAKDILLYGVKLTQQAYELLIVASAYITQGYRRFASGVDHLTDKYNKVRERLK